MELDKKRNNSDDSSTAICDIAQKDLREPCYPTVRQFVMRKIEASNFLWCCSTNQGPSSVMQHVVSVDSLSLLLHSTEA